MIQVPAVVLTVMLMSRSEVGMGVSNYRVAFLTVVPGIGETGLGNGADVDV